MNNVFSFPAGSMGAQIPALDLSVFAFSMLPYAFEIYKWRLCE